MLKSREGGVLTQPQSQLSKKVEQHKTSFSIIHTQKTFKSLLNRIQELESLEINSEPWLPKQSQQATLAEVASSWQWQRKQTQNQQTPNTESSHTQRRPVRNKTWGGHHLSYIQLVIHLAHKLQDTTENTDSPAHTKQTKLSKQPEPGGWAMAHFLP